MTKHWQCIHKHWKTLEKQVSLNAAQKQHKLVCKTHSEHNNLPAWFRTTNSYMVATGLHGSALLRRYRSLFCHCRWWRTAKNIKSCKSAVKKQEDMGYWQIHVERRVPGTGSSTSVRKRASVLSTRKMVHDIFSQKPTRKKCRNLGFFFMHFPYKGKCAIRPNGLRKGTLGSWTFSERFSASTAGYYRVLTGKT